MKVIDIPELISTLVKAIYDNVKSRDKVDRECKILCQVDVVIHQLFVLGF